MYPSRTLANRANAQHSTGPRTAAGKARSRFNALKHGLDAKEEILPGENPEVRAELTAAYCAEHDPQGPTETYLVETLAQKDWERKRLLKIVAQIARTMLDGQALTDTNLGAAMLKDPAAAKVLEKAYRRLDSSHRAWMKALSELRRLQHADPCSESEPETAEPQSDPVAVTSSDTEAR